MVVIGLLVLASACRLELDVNVSVAEDGSGEVEVVVGVDPDGIERIGGDLGSVLEVEDLTEAGWVVRGPEVESDGYTRVRIRRTFADAEEADAIFSDIAGERGPFQDFAVRRESSFATTEWGFTGRVDFSGGLEAFGDDGLAAELDGQPLGLSVEELEAQLGEPLSRLIQVRVGVRLPGDVTSNATMQAPDGAVWQVGFGDRTMALDAEGKESRTTTWVAVGVAVGCAILLLVYGLARLAMRSRAKRRADEVSGDEPAS